MRVELQELHKKLGTTMIYVTHDQTEAMTLGTRIVVMKEGRIQQADTPEMIYDNPANLFVAGFIGSPSMNFLEGLIRREGSRTVFETEGAPAYDSWKQRGAAWQRVRKPEDRPWNPPGGSVCSGKRR